MVYGSRTPGKSGSKILNLQTRVRFPVALPSLFNHFQSFQQLRIGLSPPGDTRRHSVSHSTGHNFGAQHRASGRTVLRRSPADTEVPVAYVASGWGSCCRTSFGQDPRLTALLETHRPSRSMLHITSAFPTIGEPESFSGRKRVRVRGKRFALSLRNE